MGQGRSLAMPVLNKCISRPVKLFPNNRVAPRWRITHRKHKREGKNLDEKLVRFHLRTFLSTPAVFPRFLIYVKAQCFPPSIQVSESVLPKKTPMRPNTPVAVVFVEVLDVTTAIVAHLYVAAGAIG